MENPNKIQTGNCPGEVESDSGDSLFLTQKPVPKAVRSGRPHRLSERSTPISPRFLEDSGSSSASEAEDVPERSKKPQHLPKYRFAFLKQRSHRDGYFSSQSNTALHYYAMGGFFNCVRELWPDGKKSKSNESFLPTVDEETEEITPLTEEEKTDDEDIKIVSKKMLVYSLQPHKTKSSRLWYKPQKKENEGSTKDSAKNTTKTVPFTSNKHKGLWRKDREQPPSLDSDATLIEDLRNISGEAQEDAPENITQLQSRAGPVNDLCPVEELDNTESQSILQNSPSVVTKCTDNNTCKEKRFKNKKKHKNMVLGDETDNRKKLVNGNVAANQEIHFLFEGYSTKSPPPTVLHDNIPKKKRRDQFKKNKINEWTAENGSPHNTKCDFETSQRSEAGNVSCNAEKEINRQIVNEDAEILSSCLVETLNSDDIRIQKKKKKKKHKKKKDDQENVDIETGTTLDPGQTMTNVQQDNTNNSELHEEVSELSDKREKHKKKQKAISDNYIDQEDVSPKKHKKRFKLDEMNLSKSVKSHEQSELVNHKVSATNSITTLSDESVSVRKKKKKKRRDSFVEAETVENSHPPLSQSEDTDRAETLGISTNELESAEDGGQLHVPVLELGNRVKKKKKKHQQDVHNEFDKSYTLFQSDKVMESTEMSKKNKCKRNEREECDGAKVAYSQSEHCEQRKKKKKSKHESHHAKIMTVQQMSPRVEEESSIKSPNASENQLMKKQKRKRYDNDVDKRNVVETTDLEQSTAKRKKHKHRVKGDDPDVSTPSCVEMSPSSGSPVNRIQIKVKKRLYNPNDNHLQMF